jgi:ABC-2 type transport system permease protein
MRLRLETQYRGAMIGGILCQLFFGLILVSLYRALYAGKPQAVPIEHVTTYVWIQQALFRILTSTDVDLYNKIRSGNISYDLCRPVSMYWFYYARAAAQKLMGSLMRGAPMIVFALCLPRGWGLILPDSPAELALAVAALIPGFLCMCALENITIGITMRTLDPRGISGMLSLLMITFSGNLLPLTLFPDRWQAVIRWLPYSQLLDAPIRFYTGEYAPAEALRVIPLQVFWAAVLIGLGAWLWDSNRKRLIVQGG